MRMTPATLRVLEALLEEPGGEHWGYRLQRCAGLRSGSLYPILGRLEQSGWITGNWEQVAEHEGRPPRRYYRLTGLGEREARAALLRGCSLRSLPGEAS